MCNVYEHAYELLYGSQLQVNTPTVHNSQAKSLYANLP